MNYNNNGNRDDKEIQISMPVEESLLDWYKDYAIKTGTTYQSLMAKGLVHYMVAKIINQVKGGTKYE